MGIDSEGFDGEKVLSAVREIDRRKDRESAEKATAQRLERERADQAMREIDRRFRPVYEWCKALDGILGQKFEKDFQLEDESVFELYEWEEDVVAVKGTTFYLEASSHYQAEYGYDIEKILDDDNSDPFFGVAKWRMSYPLGFYFEQDENTYCSTSSS